MSIPAGRHFLQISGPTNVPDRILRAIVRPTMDHCGPAFGRLGQRVLTGLREIFATRGDVAIFPSSGTGAWEAALVNTLSPGDTVLMSETGHFSTLWTATGWDASPTRCFAGGVRHRVLDQRAGTGAGLRDSVALRPR